MVGHSRCWYKTKWASQCTDSLPIIHYLSLLTTDSSSQVINGLRPECSQMQNFGSIAHGSKQIFLLTVVREQPRSMASSWAQGWPRPGATSVYIVMTQYDICGNPELLQVATGCHGLPCKQVMPQFATGHHGGDAGPVGMISVATRLPRVATGLPRIATQTSDATGCHMLPRVAISCHGFTHGFRRPMIYK